jgi:TonB family protein
MAAVVVEAALRSAALMIAVWLLLRLARVRDPALERTAWLGVLIASLAMPLAMNVAALPAAIMPEVAWLPSIEIGAMTVSNDSFDWQYALLWMYAAIAGALCLRQCIGIARLWRLRSAATSMQEPRFSAFDLRMSSAVSSPATVFSTILVPSDFSSWSDAELQAVVAHEQTHVVNKDFYVQSLAQLHRNVFWFNPLAWWLPRRLSLLSEHISDDAAVAQMSERTAYAELLLTFARKSFVGEHAVAMARSATLATRVERILDTDARPALANRWTKIVIATLLSPVVVMAATIQSEDTAKQDPAATQSQPFAKRTNSTTADSKIVLPRSNRTRPLSQPVYPPVSRQLREAGTVVLKLHVLEDGSVGDAQIEKSSGHPSLDYAAMYESFRWKLNPGTVNGQPQRMWGQFAVTFKLKKPDAPAAAQS